MTCIVGLETEDGVLMAGDSAAVGDGDRYATRLTKVFRRGAFLIGYTTSFRMGQLLQYRLLVEPQDDEQTDLEYMATTFIDAVRACLKEGGFAKVENEQEQGGSFLVGYAGKLYSVASDFQVNSSRDGYLAIGSGEYVALGCIWSNLGQLGDRKASPDAIVISALEAAEHFNNYVYPPYYTEFLPTAAPKR